jgi:hypothetical protein
MRLDLRAPVVSALAFLAAFSAAASACSDTPGLPTITVDASRTTFPDPDATAADAAVDADAADAGDDGACAVSADAAPSAGAATFDALYADLFRHEGVAKCQTAGPCHGASASPAGGFSMGTGAHALYCAITSHKIGTRALVAKGSTSRADSAILDLLSPSAAGDPAFMPDTSHCELQNRKLLPEELARIGAWLDQGAPESPDAGPCP